MSRPEARTCAVCGEVSETTSDHSVHATLAHPELSRAHRREHGTTAVRPVSCWRCADLIPVATRTCPSCGWEHPGFEAEAQVQRVAEATGLAKIDLKRAVIANLDHRGRALDS
jgi:hypothetical protein